MHFKDDLCPKRWSSLWWNCHAKQYWDLPHPPPPPPASRHIQSPSLSRKTLPYLQNITFFGNRLNFWGGGIKSCNWQYRSSERIAVVCGVLGLWNVTLMGNGFWMCFVSPHISLIKDDQDRHCQASASNGVLMRSLQITRGGDGMSGLVCSTTWTRLSSRTASESNKAGPKTGPGTCDLGHNWITWKWTLNELLRLQNLHGITFFFILKVSVPDISWDNSPVGCYNSHWL